MTELEQQILNAAKAGIAKSIGDTLGNTYNSPLQKLVNEVVSTNADEIKSIMSEAFSKVISTNEFRVGIMEAFQHKVAKMLVSNLEGSVQKAVEALKQDPTIRSKMILAIEEIVKQNLPDKSTTK